MYIAFQNILKESLQIMKTLLEVCALGPRLYTIGFNSEGRSYVPNFLEALGSTAITFGHALGTLCASSSPVLVPYMLMRYDVSAIVNVLKCAVVIYSATFFLRAVGRIINSDYRDFASHVIEISNNLDANAKNFLSRYDYECSVFPATTFKAKRRSSKWFPPFNDECSVLTEPFNSLRSMLAYWAAHSFGRRLLYPGSLSLLKSAVSSTLIENRKKYLGNRGTERNIIKTEDNNFIDTFFWDRRNKSTNGNTLVICFEGNGGFYEVGIATTPNALEYSVLGWNTPGFGESTGEPFPRQIINATDAVIQFAIEKLGFSESEIVLYAWSIGGFPASWAATNYPNIKALILDACFDDLMPLAVHRMPAFMESIIHFTVRKYLDLPVASQLRKYSGPVRLIRRWNEEIIITDDASADSSARRATNRANYLLIDFLRHRYPGLLLEEKDEQMVHSWLAIDSQSRLFMFNSSDPVLPYDLNILEHKKRSVIIQQLCNKHFVDFDASHNVPLDPLFFNIPTALDESFPGVGHVLGNTERKSSRDSIQTLSSLTSSSTSENGNGK